jgi:hypothetical protein
VAAALSRLERLRDAAPPRDLDRLVVCDHEDDELALREAGIDRYVRIASGQGALRRVEQHELVVYAYSDLGLGLDAAPHVVTVPMADAADACLPERETAFVEANRRTLEAMADLARLVGRESMAHRVLASIEGLDANRPVEVGAAAQRALACAQEVFEAGVRDLSLGGADILDLLGRGTPGPLREARVQAVAAGRRAFEQETGLGLDPFAPGLPLTLDEEEVERVEARAGARRAIDAFEAASTAAATIRSHREALRQELAAWFRFDVDFALGRWARDHEAHPAATGDRLRLKAAAHLDVVRSKDVQRIDYEIGADAKAVVLTGANSGGKTTLLELLAQAAILHHWGLPVPAADAEVPILDEVRVFGASRGLDAGAFESFLNDLFPPVVAPGRKLLLLDEVEAATELEAAGRILGAFLDEVSRSDSWCVLVTHLPDEVLRHARAAVRVDGIDAVGLDDRFNLVVDRQPKMGHRAKSTPELILRRVHARSDGALKDVFARILARWA